MISSIVVGVDGSDAAGRALRFACEIAKTIWRDPTDLPILLRDETVTYAAEAISGFYVGPNVAHKEVLREAADKLIRKGTGNCLGTRNRGCQCSHWRG